MADNIALKNDDVTTIATLRTDEISSVHYATTKISLGADGTHDGFVASGNPMPVSLTSTTITGTVAATQSGTWNVTNVSGTISLPTGAATAAKQPALGTAGTASADVISIQGIASMTPIQVGDNSGSLTVDDGGTTLSVDDGGGTLTVDGTVTIQDGSGSITVDGTVTVQDGGGSLTVDGTVAVTDGGGSLTVDGTVAVSAGSAVIGKVSIDQTTPGTTNLVALAGNQTVDLNKINSEDPDIGNGAVGLGTLRVSMANDSTGILAGVTTVTTLTNITNWGNVVDNAAFTDGTTRVLMGGYVFDEVAGTALTENDAAAARIDSKRAQVFTLEDATTRGQRLAISSGGAISANNTQVNGVAISVGNGAVDTGTQRVTLCNDGTGIIATVGTVTTVDDVTTVGTVTVVDDVTTVGTVTTVSTVTAVTTVGTLTNITNWGNVVDNAAFTDGTTRLSMSGFIYDEVAGTALTENDAAAARINANRALVGCIEDGSTRARYATVTASNALKVDGSAVTQPVSAASLPLPSGAATAAKQPALGTAGTASADVISVQGIASMTPIQVTVTGSTDTATTGVQYVSTASTNATNVKASAGTIYSLQATNVNAAVRYLKIYNKATTPTVGTDTPIATYLIPINGTLTVNFGPLGMALSAGLGFALTTGATVADTGAVSASEHIVNLQYK